MNNILAIQCVYFIIPCTKGYLIAATIDMLIIPQPEAFPLLN